ncbi:hypothetical protein FH972_002525 [Carpinus fangiana]|uniref:S-protein homolog n=1 Tax=Carpinus fangiana TaxID=176857 RepID=A0A5N6QH10_9ROSI|nr:hypothetical protein FH972_002525 [Carpinus fangiana]
MSHSLRLALMLVLILYMSQPSTTYSLLKKYGVDVFNGFQNQTLSIRCQSEDDDLGIQHIPVNGEFQWHFRINYWGTTLYFCYMWWSGGHRRLDVFWADNKFIVDDCGDSDCRWMGKEDGIYLYISKHNEYRLQSRWEPWQA